jgi:glutathione synthase/RimK-type ligase-like ATP-grasp enzyme
VSNLSCWGIFRERAHSPGREFDDAAILRLTAKHLAAEGFRVSLRSPEDVGAVGERVPPSIFLMCERLGILRQLRRWEVKGVCLVNAPSAVLNTYRHHMVPLFERHAIPFPPSIIVPTHAAAYRGPCPVWVKRADVHNTQDGDVVFASTAAAVCEALDSLAQRGIRGAVIQEHISGDVIKFYGVGDPARLQGQRPWFRWFYHQDQVLAGHPFDPRCLATMAQRAAAALGLEVYGGDAIATKGGALVLIDLNAWPSFALYRDEASAQIASYLTQRFTRGERDETA